MSESMKNCCIMCFIYLLMDFFLKNDDLLILKKKTNENWSTAFFKQITEQYQYVIVCIKR